jgi:hypothetical protein
VKRFVGNASDGRANPEDLALGYLHSSAPLLSSTGRREFFRIDVRRILEIK